MPTASSASRFAGEPRSISSTDATGSRIRCVCLLRRAPDRHVPESLANRGQELSGQVPRLMEGLVRLGSPRSRAESAGP